MDDMHGYLRQAYNSVESTNRSPGEKIGIAIVDDHPSVADGLAGLLTRFPDMTVKFTANDGEEMLEKLKHEAVSIVLLDLQMPRLDGDEAFKILTERYPSIRVIIFTNSFSPSIVFRYLRQNAASIISKTWSIHKIAEIIRAVHDKGEHVDESISALIKNFLGKSDQGIDRPDLKLNLLEIRILKLICTGYTTSEIAKLLGRSEKTITWHRNHIWQTTGVTSGDVDQLTLYALRHNIVTVF
jgi:DNA-binding NarL/FixJ family response regulator